MGFVDEKMIKSTETKTHQSKAIHPSKLGLGRIRVVQARVRARRDKKAKYSLN